MVKLFNIEFINGIISKKYTSRFWISCIGITQKKLPVIGEAFKVEFNN